MIIVVSYPEDEHTRQVVDLLKEARQEVKQINLADFPSRQEMNFSWFCSTDSRFDVGNGENLFDLRKAKAIWWRRIRSYEIDPAITNVEMRYFATSETTQAVEGVLDSLQCKWVNNKINDAAAHHKPYQWSVAQEVGLKIPETLVTTNPEKARAFIQSNRRTVFKPFLAAIQTWRETRLIEPSDMQKLDLVRYAPVLFQEYIEGVDLRITVVGNKVFAAEIDAQKTRYPFDMRMVIGEAKIKAVQLPSALTEQLLKLQRRLGLEYGAIDMRRTKEGDYYFFEVNPAGQWLFVEQYTGLKITQAMADLLSACANN